MSSVLSAIGLAGMMAAIAYGVAEVRRLDRLFLAKVDSLVVLGARRDSLRTEVDRIRHGPLDSLLQPRALAIPAGNVACTEDYSGIYVQPGICRGFVFLVWLELPYARRSEIRRVTYEFSGHSTARQRTGEEASNGFLTGFLGWYPWPSVPTTVETTDGERFTFQLPMERLVRDAGFTVKL